MRLKLPRENLFLAVYILGASLLSLLLVLLGGPDPLLITLIGPVVFAAIFYLRRIYVAMVLFNVLISIAVTYRLSINFYESLKTIAALALTVIGICEVIHWLMATRRRAEHALHTSETRYRAISELTSDYVYAVQITPDGRHVAEWVTEAFTRITGYTVEEMEARGGWPALVHPDDKPINQQRTETVLAGRLDVSELRIITKAGEIRWLRAYTRPEWDAGHQRVVRVLGAIQDITERKRAEETRLALERKLLETQKLESLGALAGGIAHDFNNLLQVVIGNVGLTLRDLSPGSPGYESIKQIEQAARRAADLTGQMLAYSGKGRFIVQAVDLNSIVTEMLAILQVSTARTVALSQRLGADLPPIEADATQIRQIIMNLVVNASEAIGETSGAITLATGVIDASRAYLDATPFGADLPEGRYVYLEVRDSGPGMDAATSTRIFEPFFTTKFTGRGLGLAAVQGIVRGHRGTLKVQSEHGRGTTFTILFPAGTPLQEVRGAGALGSAGAAPYPAVFSGAVLIVDDEENVRAVAARILERWGFSVLTASDGPAALELFRAHASEIVAVLLDLTMPRMSGERVFAELQRIRPDARIVMMSGYSKEEVTSRLTDMGVAGFIQKPFTPTVLRDSVRRVLAQE